MPATMQEAWTGAQGTAINVQITPRAGITTLSVSDFLSWQTNLQGQRHGSLLIEIDGDFYEIFFTFATETYDGLDLRGRAKLRNKQTAGQEVG